MWKWVKSSKEPWQQGPIDACVDVLRTAALLFAVVGPAGWLLYRFVIEPERAQYVARCKAAGGESVIYFPRGGCLCISKDGRVLFPDKG